MKPEQELDLEGFNADKDRGGLLDLTREDNGGIGNVIMKETPEEKARGDRMNDLGNELFTTYKDLEDYVVKIRKHEGIGTGHGDPEHVQKLREFADKIEADRKELDELKAEQ